jgi:hypothetical protein
MKKRLRKKIAKRERRKFRERLEKLVGEAVAYQLLRSISPAEYVSPFPFVQGAVLQVEDLGPVLHLQVFKGKELP